MVWDRSLILLLDVQVLDEVQSYILLSRVLQDDDDAPASPDSGLLQSVRLQLPDFQPFEAASSLLCSLEYSILLVSSMCIASAVCVFYCCPRRILTRVDVNLCTCWLRGTF